MAVIADTKVLFDIIARDRASQAFQSASGGASQLQKTLGGLAKVAAGGALLKFGRDAVAAARESNKVAAQTEAVIRSTGGAANVSAKQFADLATQISRKTGVDDEQIQSAENLIATFTNVRNEVGKGNDVFTQATKIAVDMGAALGTDASGSAIQLGKALNDPIKGITALTRVGVTFTEQQREQIRTLVEAGKTLDAQKIILAELNKEFGGSAAAQATAADRLRVSFGNLEESIGNLLVPALDKLAAGADVAVGFIDGLPAPLKAATISAAGLAVAAGPLLSVYDNVGRVFANVSGRMRDADGQTTNFGRAVKGLAFVGGTVAALEAVQLGAQALGAGARSAADDIRDLSTATDRFLADQFRAGLQGNSALQKVILALGPGSDVTDDIRNRFRRIAAESESSAQRIIDALDKQGVDTSAYVKILDEEEGKSKAVARSQRDHAKAVDENTDSQDKNNKVTTDALTIAKNAADADQRRKDLIDAMTKSLDDRRNAILADADAEVALARADNAAQDALNAYNDAVKEHGNKSDQAKRAVLDYRTALSSAAQAAVDAAAKDREAHGQAALTVQEKVAIQIAELGKLRDALDPKSPLRKVVDDYIARLGSIPTEINTRLTITANAVPDLQVSIGGGSYTGGGTSVRRAAGGPVKAGMPYLVGDKYGLRFAEWFVPQVDGTILPDVGALQPAATSGGGWNFGPGSIIVNGEASERDAATVARELRSLAWVLEGV